MFYRWCVKSTIESLEKKVKDMPYTPIFFVQETSYLDEEVCRTIEDAIAKGRIAMECMLNND